LRAHNAEETVSKLNFSFTTGFREVNVSFNPGFKPGGEALL
jgi:hypothetical protein